MKVAYKKDTIVMDVSKISKTTYLVTSIYRGTESIIQILGRNIVGDYKNYSEKKQ